MGVEVHAKAQAVSSEMVEVCRLVCLCTKKSVCTECKSVGLSAYASCMVKSAPSFLTN